MTTLSNILAWVIPWTKEPSGLQSIGSQKNWTRLSDQACTSIKFIGIITYRIII